MARHSRSRRRQRRGVAALAVRAALIALFALVMLVAWSAVRVASIDVASLATRNPGPTALMRQREHEAAQEGRRWHPSRHWVAYARISPHLRHAVLVAEDDAFFSHGGLDWSEIRASARRDLEALRFVRGGSTITQQLAKNLWLSTSRSPTRKFEELLLALRLERALNKRRIFELYLNVIEWGDGVFGAEAAARHWFGTSAGTLDARQSVRLAAVIINPRRYSPVDPSRRITRRVRLIAGRLRRRGVLTEADWRIVLGLPQPAPAAASGIARDSAAQPDSTAGRPGPAGPGP